MDFKNYQDMARKTAIYPSDSQVIYPVLGLAGETGEVCEKVKKQIRDRDGNLDDEKFLTEVGKELADCLWYIANIAFDLKLDLNTLAEQNIAKLKDRQERGVLGGNGDNR